MILKASATKRRSPWLRIQVLNRQRRFRLFPVAVTTFCAEILEELAQPDCSMSVVFVSARKMRALNRHYRGKDYATDVLSFSYGDAKAQASGDLQTGFRTNEAEAPYLGDMVISPEVACCQALRYGVPPEKEMRRLLVHGILHLLGYDHEIDNGEMNQLQGRLLRRRAFQLGDSVIQSNDPEPGPLSGG